MFYCFNEAEDIIGGTPDCVPTDVARVELTHASLAGQDAQYLADAIHAYKAGARSKSIACAGCHGEGGISKKTGMPNLAGLSPQYLVPAMKASAMANGEDGLDHSGLLLGVERLSGKESGQ